MTQKPPTVLVVLVLAFSLFSPVPANAQERTSLTITSFDFALDENNPEHVATVKTVQDNYRQLLSLAKTGSALLTFVQSKTSVEESVLRGRYNQWEEDVKITAQALKHSLFKAVGPAVSRTIEICVELGGRSIECQRVQRPSQRALYTRARIMKDVTSLYEPILLPLRFAMYPTP